MTIKYWAVRQNGEYRVFKSLDPPDYMQFEMHKGFRTLKEAKEKAIEMIDEDIAELRVQKYMIKEFRLKRKVSV